jgi:hypothetical protein
MQRIKLLFLEFGLKKVLQIKQPLSSSVTIAYVTTELPHFKTPEMRKVYCILQEPCCSQFALNIKTVMISETLNIQLTHKKNQQQHRATMKP